MNQPVQIEYVAVLLASEIQNQMSGYVRVASGYCQYGLVSPSDSDTSHSLNETNRLGLLTADWHVVPPKHLEFTDVCSLKLQGLGHLVLLLIQVGSLNQKTAHLSNQTPSTAPSEAKISH